MRRQVIALDRLAQVSVAPGFYRGRHIEVECRRSEPKVNFSADSEPIAAAASARQINWSSARIA
jgi:hypothetical protein